MRRCAGRARVKHVDETGWARAARWLFAAVTASGVAAFALCHARTYAGVKRLLGERAGGTICTDRFGILRQVSPGASGRVLGAPEA